MCLGSSGLLNCGSCMQIRLTRGPWWAGFCLLQLVSVAFAQTVLPASSPTTIFSPVSTPAKSIFDLSLFVLAVTAVIFTVVFSLLVYSVVRFRKRRDDDGREPPQIYGSNQVCLL